MSVFYRALSGAGGLLAAGLGLAISYDCYYLYYSEANNPFYYPPLWKSGLVLALLILAFAVPMLAAYKLIYFAITGRR